MGVCRSAYNAQLSFGAGHASLFFLSFSTLQVLGSSFFVAWLLVQARRARTKNSRHAGTQLVLPVYRLFLFAFAASDAFAAAAGVLFPEPALFAQVRHNVSDASLHRWNDGSADYFVVPDFIYAVGHTGGRGHAASPADVRVPASS